MWPRPWWQRELPIPRPSTWPGDQDGDRHSLRAFRDAEHHRTADSPAHRAGGPAVPGARDSSEQNRGEAAVDDCQPGALLSSQAWNKASEKSQPALSLKGESWLAFSCFEWPQPAANEKTRQIRLHLRPDLPVSTRTIFLKNQIFPKCRRNHVNP